jgi:hypothetical protein
VERCLPVVDEIREHHQAYDVEGVTLSDGSIQVSVLEPDGTAVFESHFPVVRADGRYLEWEYRGETPYSMSVRVDDKSSRTVQGMAGAAKDIVRAIKRGRVSGGRFKPETDDNYGCDWPFDDVTCGQHGNCCDEHDACYDTFRCSALSWLGLESPLCIACNVALVLCTEGPIGGPSTCCAAGNCGQTRPSMWWGYFSDDVGGGEDIQYDEGGSGSSGSGGTLAVTPWGSVVYGGGTCLFPDGTIIPCS